MQALLQTSMTVTAGEKNQLASSTMGKSIDTAPTSSTVLVTSVVTVANDQPESTSTEIAIPPSVIATYTGSGAEQAASTETDGDSEHSGQEYPIATKDEPEPVVCLPVGQPQLATESFAVMGKPRVTCHRCGNVRKNTLSCKSCLQVYCVTCAQKFESTSNTGFRFNTTGSSCPVCENLCCCSNSRGVSCERQFHCYRRCEVSRVKSNKIRGRKRARENTGVSDTIDTSQMSQFTMPWMGAYPGAGMGMPGMIGQQGDPLVPNLAPTNLANNAFFAQEMQRRFVELTASMGYGYQMPGMPNAYGQQTFQGMPMAQGIPVSGSAQVHSEQSGRGMYPMNPMNMSMMMQQNMQQMHAMQQQQLQHFQTQNYGAQSSAANQPKPVQAGFKPARAARTENTPSADAYAVGMNMAATALALLANAANDNKEDDGSKAS